MTNRNVCMKNWRKENKEKKKEYDKKHYEKNKERILKRKMEYYYEHKEQISKKRKEWSKNNRDKVRERNIQNKFNISIKEFEDMKKSQNGRCAICQKRERIRGRNLAIDHNHKTGKVRALLCSRCNTGLGYFLEDVHLLNRAVEYLIHHSQL